MAFEHDNSLGIVYAYLLWVAWFMLGGLLFRGESMLDAIVMQGSPDVRPAAEVSARCLSIVPRDEGSSGFEAGGLGKAGGRVVHLPSPQGFTLSRLRMPGTDGGEGGAPKAHGPALLSVMLA